MSMPAETGLLLCSSALALVSPFALFLCAKQKASTVSPAQPAAPPKKAPAPGADKNPTSISGNKLSDLKPKQVPLNEKEAKIAQGQKKGKGDYPTMEDVVSDWSTDDGDKKKKKAKDGGKTKSIKDEKAAGKPNQK
ncbi:hypothetical protein QR680_012254 [Steinernema hermaphroditum]|uniref:Uncharacterized protein n=1 Tax=Steinernema hermaphroditum TaxID=289476 RepID=A0AA39I2Q7_9BILA|nr:hypothetical protein QR680_012238 [Steinernema hermaphroditum]KAK0416023.1 hypothetical protein QR680_012254 [Steinernema hermaphroditum]